MRIETFDPVAFHKLPYIVGSATAANLPFRHAWLDSLPDGLEAIIATGDLQGVVRTAGTMHGEQLLGVALAAELQLLRGRGVLPSKENTAVLLTGDLQPSADVADVRSVWFRLAETCRWLAGVAGNHDAFGAGEESKATAPSLHRSNMYFLDGRVASVGSLTVGGLSGTVGNSGEAWVRSSADFTAAMERLVGYCPDILLSHDGPNVAGTDLAGWPDVRKVLEAGAPTLLFRGHDTWSTPLATLANGTQVVNVEGNVLVMSRAAR